MFVPDSVVTLLENPFFHKTPRDGIKADFFLKFQIHKKKGFVATLSKSVLICLVLLFFFQKSKITELIFAY